MIGTTISHYHIIEKLGEGGMGVVYKAEDTRLKRTVALKFLPPHTLSSEEERERFTREAQASAALNHPNIATVYEIDEHNAARFIAMEFIDGQSLHEKVQAGPMKISDALDAAIQIAEGLNTAHENGIVHRDMKSANVMVTGKGQVKIMDFGLAKLKGVSLLTRQGSTLGTVSYMSPEQGRGESVDHRTDIWSLGVVLYEMLTGRLPFAGEFEQAILFGILNNDPEPLTSLRSNVPMELERIMAKLLAKDPADRYQSAREIPVDLRALKAGIKSSPGGATKIAAPSGFRTSGPQKRKDLVLWLTAGLLAVVAGVALWSPWKTPEAPPMVGRFEITLPQGEALDMVVYSSLAISPDGSRIVYRANGKLYLRELGDFTATPLPGTEESGGPFFSPDGNWIGFFNGGKLKKISIHGGSAIVLAEATDSRGGSWGSNGMIAYTPTVTNGIWLIPDVGGEPRQITFPDSTKQERTHRSPSFLPDGETILYTVGTRESPDYYEDAVIEAVDVASGQRKIVLSGASTAQYVSTGHLIHSRAGVLHAAPFDIDRVEVTGPLVPLIEGVDGDATSGAMHYSISSLGTLVYIPGGASGGRRSLSLVDLSGNRKDLTAHSQTYSEPRISPDGKRIAVVLHADRDSDVWVYDLVRGTLSRLTFGGTNRTPTWSPDGKRLAYYTASPEARGKIFVKNADGSGEPELASSGHGRTYLNGWTRDGSSLVTDRSTGGGQSDIYIIPIGVGQNARSFVGTKYDEYQAAISPDGKWLGYVSNESGTYQVYVQPFPTGSGKWQISTDGGWEPRWSPDGRILYYTTGQRMMAATISTTNGFSAGSPRVLFGGYRPVPVDSGISYDVLPDGTGFVVTLPHDVSRYQQIRVVVNWFEELQAKAVSVR